MIHFKNHVHGKNSNMIKKNNSKKRKNAEFNLPQFVLNLVIAVIVLVIIMFAATNLYSGYQQKTDIDHATEGLGLINAKINYIQESGLDHDIVTIQPPSEWYLRSYIGASPPGSTCTTKTSCICICKEPRCFDNQKSCSDSDHKVEITPIMFEKDLKSVTLKINKNDDKITVTQ